MILLKKRDSFVSFLIIITIVFSVIFQGPNYHHYPFADFKDLVLIGFHWGLSALGLFVLITIMALNRFLYLVLFPGFTLIASVTAYFTWHIDVSINSALIESLLLTNVGEVSSYLSWSLIVFVLFALALSILSVVFRFHITLKKKQIAPLIILVFVSITLFVVVNTKRYNTLMVRAPFSYYLAIDTYLADIEEIKKERLMLGEAGGIESNDSLITIFIIGEALRADHIQINGYHRETMPNMEQRGCYIISSHLFTLYPYSCQFKVYTDKWIIRTKLTPRIQ
jgi:lipid A ethanolaminephosphotransferase